MNTFEHHIGISLQLISWGVLWFLYQNLYLAGQFYHRTFLSHPVGHFAIKNDEVKAQIRLYLSRHVRVFTFCDELISFFDLHVVCCKIS